MPWLTPGAGVFENELGQEAIDIDSDSGDDNVANTSIFKKIQKYGTAVQLEYFGYQIFRIRTFQTLVLCHYQGRRDIFPGAR